jgi:phosphonate transport system substrate-binding protein
VRSGAAPVGAPDLEPGTDRPLVFATYLAPRLIPVYQSIAAAVAERVGIPVRLEVGRSFKQLLTGEIDVAFLCGLPYVRQAQHLDPLAAPVVAGDRYGGRPVYFSDVIVRRDSPFHTFADLRGASWSFNDPDSHSGYLATLTQLLDLGQTETFFGRVIDAGWHQVSVGLVASGQVDASAVDSHVLALELRDRPELATRLRVIESFGPSPIQPVVARRSLDAGFRQQLREILGGMTGEGLRQGLVERLVAITDADYDPIRTMLARVTEAGLTLSPTDPAASPALATADR